MKAQIEEIALAIGLVFLIAVAEVDSAQFVGTVDQQTLAKLSQFSE